MLNYTVVLLMPDYIAGRCGETRCINIAAANPRTAVRAAQATAQAGNINLGRRTDFLPVFVALGHHTDLTGEV